ncbi:hypothetical protein RFI_27955 [Reticulomyxa filosa]|uniref:N-sulphoglucosamine sulphohydrolase C-terminal domain-containing protein n=1 Tax=Reticulomyxa filosa TaxID=46433 RepID=X6M7K2_RETFI|nr:hypothetical protein RFI_27955 [Reticulomyxa filosa]|eukprot:ETO09422.1 hypothetical protein RFI_27955 [Reticulomyxa filosa]
MYETDIRVPMYLRGPNIRANTSSNAIVGNVDILPTFIDLAGIDLENKDEVMDGKSMVGTVIKMEGVPLMDTHYKKFGGQGANASGWRDYFLSEYRRDGTGVNNFGLCQLWFPNASDTLSPYVPGAIITPPGGPYGNTTWWLVDDQYSNNWRMLRILNESHNWSYGEFVNYNWTEQDFENPMFFEFYDINIDPWQMNNTYILLNEETKQVLHNMLMQYGNCSGLSCP